MKGMNINWSVSGYNSVSAPSADFRPRANIWNKKEYQTKCIGLANHLDWPYDIVSRSKLTLMKQNKQWWKKLQANRCRQIVRTPQDSWNWNPLEIQWPGHLETKTFSFLAHLGEPLSWRFICCPFKAEARGFLFGKVWDACPALIPDFQLNISCSARTSSFECCSTLLLPLSLSITDTGFVWEWAGNVGDTFRAWS